MESIKKYRYPGIGYFETIDSDIFYGRKDDRKKLSELVEIEKTVLLYSRSGLGKSSLINAALIPELISRNNLPFYIRLRRYQENSQTPVENILRQTVLASQKSLPVTFLQKFINRNLSLWYAFKSLQIQSSSADKPVCLIFDQFEEIAGYPANDILEFKKQLSELLYTNIPKLYLDAVKNDLLTEPLTEEELSLLYKHMRLNAVFAIRSDQISLLSQFSDYFSNILKVNYELKPLTRDQALEAIKEPADKEKGENFIGEKFSYEKKALDKILCTLDEENKNEIDTSQLQIILQHIERNIVGDKKEHTVTEQELGDLNTVYANYYANCLASLPAQKEEAQLLIEDKLIINGTRISYDMKLCLKEVSKETLDALVQTRLLRQEANTTGGFSYEIAHDTLIEAILKSKKEREKIEYQIAEARKYKNEHYQYLENKDYKEAVRLLENAIKIFDISEREEEESIETRILLARTLEASGDRVKAEQFLMETLNISKLKKDITLTGRVFESLAAFYESKNTIENSHLSYKYYVDAYTIYQSSKNYLRIAWLAEHLGGFKEQLYYRLTEEDANSSDEQEFVINEAYHYYNKATDHFKLINDYIGLIRSERSRERVKFYITPWGYLTEVFTGEPHYLKGKKPVRVGRDVFDEQNNIFKLKNEIGFPNSYRLMSRRHMIIHPDLTIEDTQSLNGTTINTFPLYYGNPRKLTDNDIIVLANIMPLQFSLKEPEQTKVPDDCWGIIIDGSAKNYYYLEGLDKVFSVSLFHSEKGYSLKFSDTEDEDALMKFKYADNEPWFYTEEKMEVIPNTGDDGSAENIMATWKIRTTVKDTDRFYKDYILNTGKWFGAFDFPMEPQLRFMEKKLDDQQAAETKEGEQKQIEEEKIYAYGPAFQLIIRPEYNPQLKQYFE